MGELIMKPAAIRIATRQSPLALCQTLWVKEQLLAHYPKLNVTVIGMTTQGDQQLATSLSKVGGKGLFIKELEQALLTHTADIAVHSVKDLTVEFPQALGLAAICEREDARDAFVSCDFANLAALPVGSRVGTSSVRRQALLHALRPDLQIEVLRGNVNTRLMKLEQGEFAAIILAVAGLNRLGLSHYIREIFDPMVFLPAIGQGALAIEYRLQDQALYHQLQVLNHLPTYQCVIAERAINHRLQGGCHSPLAGYATLHAGVLQVQGWVATHDGKTVLQAAASGSPAEAERLGLQVADALIAQGAMKILQAL